MKKIDSVLISPEKSLIDALRAISGGGAQIALVVDAERRLLGTVTDADVRGAIFQGKQLEEVPCRDVMTHSPLTSPVGTPRRDCLALMKAHHIRQLPLIDDEGRVCELMVLEELLEERHLPNAVVLMAGGLGTRLGAMTKHCPKPMLPLGEKPLLESIIERMEEQGLRRFFISVNYLSEKIMRHFRDGAAWGVQVEYLVEDKALGTAGALTLLPEQEEHDILVMNGDILTMINFPMLLDYHHSSQSMATMAVAQHTVQVPYGVVNLESDNSIAGLEEKPSYSYFVNAGIYALSPDVPGLLPKDTPVDMPDIFTMLAGRQQKTMAYPLREFWLDIGTPDDFSAASRFVASDGE